MTCSVEGCSRPVRSRYADLCNTHYFRKRRTGSTGTAEVWDRKRRGCSVEGCSEPHYGLGFCFTHYRHNRKGGSPDHVGQIVRRGSDNGVWRGNSVGYTSAHQRVYRARGAARDQTCPCGSQAAHWSYNHDDPNEIEGITRGRTVRYSGDPSHYTARCVSCHKLFDQSV